MAEFKKTLTIADKATKALNGATANLQKVVTDLGGLTAISEGLTIDIEFKQSELNGIDAKIKEDLRIAKAELGIKVLENEDQVLTSLLTKGKLARVTVADLNAVKGQLETAMSDNHKAIDTAVAIAVERVESKNNTASIEAASEQKVETATLKAKIESLQSQVDNLTETNANLNRMLDDERTARVDVAKANQTIMQMPKTAV